MDAGGRCAIKQGEGGAVSNLPSSGVGGSTSRRRVSEAASGLTQRDAHTEGTLAHHWEECVRLRGDKVSPALNG